MDQDVHLGGLTAYLLDPRAPFVLILNVRYCLMPDPISSTIAFSELWGLSKTVVKLIKAYKNAPKNIQKLLTELESLNAQLEVARVVFGQYAGDHKFLRRIHEAAVRCEDALKPLEEKVRSFTLESQNVGKRFLNRARSALEVPDLERRVKSLRDTRQDLAFAIELGQSAVLNEIHFLITTLIPPEENRSREDSLQQSWNTCQSMDGQEIVRPPQIGEYLQAPAEKLRFYQIIRAHLNSETTIDPETKNIMLRELLRIAETDADRGTRPSIKSSNVPVKHYFGPNVSFHIPWRLTTYDVQIGLARGPYGGFSLGLNIRCQNRISESSPVFQACSNADIDTVRELFLKGEASPFDVDISDRSLLHYATYQRFSGGKRLEKETVELVRYLIECGTDATTGILPIMECHKSVDQDYLVATTMGVEWIKKARSFGNNRVGYAEWWLHELESFFGVDPVITVFKSMDSESLIKVAYEYTFAIDSDTPDAESDKKRVHDLSTLATLCVNGATSDPFLDPDIGVQFWDRLGGRTTVLPLDVSLLHQHQWPLLESIFETDAHTPLLNDVARVPCCAYMTSRDEDFVMHLDQSHRMIQALCLSGMLDGERSLVLQKHKGYFALEESLEPDMDAHRQSGRGHLIDFILASAMHDCCIRKRRTIYRDHCRKVLTTLLNGDEDPRSFSFIRDSRPESYSRTARSRNCLAADGLLLDIWRSALIGAGKDGNDIVDEWLFGNFTSLFEGDPAQPLSAGFENVWHCSQCHNASFDKCATPFACVEVSSGTTSWKAF
ncbi:hypothetical protein NA57DRAFT_56513 [Rhizodiscina lignyota]|uniref:Uncharacterized protein n=1 Tax=Rhizodiscina lignyota TaxID=1504668 RepID=A0A9P4M6H1_9PEZI|nr:hypothetical protein NA57DRAFT_56513 [Rhizodiscina lignyota]